MFSTYYIPESLRKWIVQESLQIDEDRMVAPYGRTVAQSHNVRQSRTRTPALVNGKRYCAGHNYGRIYFAWRFFRAFDRGQNNCYFDSAVKNTNTLQFFFLRHRLVLTGTTNGHIANRQSPVLSKSPHGYFSPGNFMNKFQKTLWKIAFM